MSLEITALTPDTEAAWDEFCAGAPNATFLHTRRFLAYHGSRFKDRSLLVTDGEKISAVFAAAESPADPALVVSHPGATYGGLVHQGRFGGMRVIEALEAISAFYRDAGYSRLQYKPVPYIYLRAPSQDDLYALFRLGARRIRCDLSCSIDLHNRHPVSERRRRGLKKALKVVTLSGDSALLGELWGVVSENLARKHGAQPVHSLAEMKMIMERFPGQVLIRCAQIDGRVEAGVIFFNSALVWHAQYIAASEAAYQVSALDAVFDAAITEAREAGARYFDFGTSNEEGGTILNDGLYQFKLEFGGGGVAHEFYELGLSK